MTATIVPADGYEYYADSVYWNDFAAVQSHINALISGGAEDWISFVKRTCGCADRLYVPNCGNGWVERDLIARGAARSAIGTDISPGLLDQARTLAADAGASAEYRVMDCNDLYLDGLGFDWTVNYAAFHHVAYLDRALRKIRMAMPETGYLISFDYTGPHRNQYPWSTWEEAVKVNEALPEKYRTKLIYPHQRTMIHMDPTEAIHSELILEFTERYFETIECRPIGGCIAYTVLYGNKALHLDQHTEEGAAVLRFILDRDAAFRLSDASRSLFTFWIAKPRRDALADFDSLDRWAREENKREADARRNGLRYYEPGALELIYDEIADLRALAAREHQ